MLNALTIDVEDYWSILYRDWLHVKDAIPSEAVVRNTRWFLQVLAEYNTKATFFILGEVAQHFPQLIKEISQAGHEIGVHGFYHRQIFKLSQEEFKKEVETTRRLLEDISGQEVIGHRAPAFSINKDTQWALEILAEEGFVYDSSISPMQGRRYGWPGFKKEIHRMPLTDGQSIIEVPMSTVSLGIKELGIGGGYMRHLPYFYTKWAIGHIQKKRSAIVYIHPYEIDTQKLDFTTDNLTGKQKKEVLKFHKMQMRNRNTVKHKVKCLLNDFEFTTIRSLIKE
jgi:polysaccharide deacetylase family protein (PEP-CTERM system associated)